MNSQNIHCNFRPNDLNESMDENRTAAVTSVTTANESSCLSEVTNSNTPEVENKLTASNSEMATNASTKKSKTKDECDATKVVKNGIYNFKALCLFTKCLLELLFLNMKKMNGKSSIWFWIFSF